MKLNILSEYALSSPSRLAAKQQQMMGAVHDFIRVVDEFFKTGARGWGTNSEIDVKYGKTSFSITIRCGINVGSRQGDRLADRPETVERPRMVVDPSWDDTVEMRLDVPRGYRERMDWGRERVKALQAIAGQASMMLPDAISRVAANIITKMRKADRIKDYHDT